jgi:hypothetical protein
MDRLYIFDTPDIPDGINGVTSDQVGTEKWFDMQGRRIDKPTKKGLYIRDGKKVVIK